MKKRKATKTIRFSVRLKGIGPESKKKLMSIGLDEHLTLATKEVTFTDERGDGFETSMFYREVHYQQEAMLREVAECVVEEVK